MTDIDNGDYIKLRQVDFGRSPKSFEARVAPAAAGGTIELHLDSLAGTLIGTLDITTTGDGQQWITKSCTISNAKGVHDLYFRFTGEAKDLFNFDWWRFSDKKTR